MGLEPVRRRLSIGVGVLGVLGLLLCLVIAITAVLLLMGDDSDDGPGGRRIVYGLTLNPSGFDPHRNASNELGIPFFSVYDTLVYRHPQRMDFVPGLAERWQMSPDGLNWTFTLRQGVTFHDGEPFNAAAVGVNLDRIMNPELASQKAKFLLGPYTGYTVVDDYTITLHLSEPYEPLLDALSQVYLGIASPKALAEYTNNTYQWHQVGTGPYKLVEVVPGDHLILERNPDYAWGPIFYAPVSEQSIDVVEFRFYTDAATRGLALESGEVQIIGDLLPTDAELLAGNPRIRIVPARVPGLPQQFFLNTQRGVLTEQAVRQALIYATNRAAIVGTVFLGQSPVAYGPLNSITPFYDPTVESMYPYDPDLARSLLQGVGFGDEDGDGWLDRGGEKLQLTMVFAPWNQMADVAQLIQSQWRDVGIEVELKQVPDYPTLVEVAGSGEYDLIALNDTGVDASLLNRFYHSEGSSNWARFSDPELDQWLESALIQPDPALRAQYYQAAQLRIMEQAVVLPVREFVSINGTSSRLDGVIFSAQGWWPLLRNILWVS